MEPDANGDLSAPSQADTSRPWSVYVFSAIGVVALILALLSFPWGDCPGKAEPLWLVASALALMTLVSIGVARGASGPVLVASGLVSNLVLLIGWVSLIGSADRFDRTLAEELEAYTGPDSGLGGVDGTFLPQYLSDYGMGEGDVRCVTGEVDLGSTEGVSYEDIKSAVERCGVDASELHQCFFGVTGPGPESPLTSATSAHVIRIIACA